MHKLFTTVCTCRVAAGNNKNRAEGAGEHANAQPKLPVLSWVQTCVAIYL
jgi:hypothetical protein